MKRIITFLLFLLLAAVLKPETAEASHLAGADLTYTAVPGQPLTYLVRLKLYRDCTGITLGNTATICYSSANCGLSSTVVAPEVAVNIVPSNACVTTTPTCPGNIGDVEEHIYETTITLPQACNDWRFSWDDCCRNPAITNLVGAGGLSLFVSALLNNVDAPTNSSPSFTNLAYTRFCVGNAFYYDQGAAEIDGDSLVFSLSSAQGNGFSCPPQPNDLTYVSPYTATQPVGSVVPMTIDQNTGLVYFVPNTIQVGVFCVTVREYRNSILVGEVKRDIQINVVGQCNPILPSFINSALTSAGGGITAGCNDYQIILPFDTNFQCGSAMPSDFRTINPLGVPNPCVNVTPINCDQGQTDSLLLTFLNPLTTGTTYLWVKKGFDGNTLLSECGAQMPDAADTVAINIIDNSVFVAAQDTVGCLFNQVTVDLTDSIYCFSIANDGSDLQMVDANGSVLAIASAWGYCNPSNQKTDKLLVNMQGGQSGANPIYLILTSNSTDLNTIANSCGRFLNVGDTIAQFYVDNKIPINLGTDIAVCANQPSPVLNSGYSNATFQWLQNGNIITGATDSAYTVTQSGSYIVNISSTPVCTGADTINVLINPDATDNLGADVIQCSGAALPLLDAGNTGATFQWYLNGTAITGATAQTYQPTASGTFTVDITIGGICTSTFDKILDNNAPNPTVAVNDTAICAGGQAVLDAGFPGYNYQWSNGATTQTINVSNTGDFAVTVSKDGCVGQDSVSVQVEQYPVAPAVLCTTEDNAQYKFIYTWNAIAGAASYEISEDNGATWTPSNSAVSTESHGTNNTVPFFLVRAIGSGLCKTGANSEPIACQVTIPNIFTPNGDGKNDYFKIENIEQYPKNSVQIFNRWGKEVFSSSPYNNSNSKFDGKDLPDGVYFYIVNLGDGTTEPKSGTVTINR